MNDELERLSKEAVLTFLRYYSSNFLGSTEEYNEESVRIADLGFEPVTS